MYMADPFSIGTSAAGLGIDGIRKAIDYYRQNKKKKEFREKFNNNVLKLILEMIFKQDGREAILAIRNAAQAELPVKKEHAGLKGAKDVAVAKTVVQSNVNMESVATIKQLIMAFKEFGQLDAIRYIQGYCLFKCKKND